MQILQWVHHIYQQKAAGFETVSLLLKCNFADF